MSGNPGDSIFDRDARFSHDMTFGWDRGGFSLRATGLNIGGARAKESSLLVDGFYNRTRASRRSSSVTARTPSRNSRSSPFGGSAEYGRAIGGIINAVTKSGGNEFRGSAYGFFRNESLNAIGKCADFFAINLERLEYAGGLHDPVAAALFCAPVRADYVYIGGKPVVQEGQLLTLDLPWLVEQHNQAAMRLMRT